jgi:hypothetical protein
VFAPCHEKSARGEDFRPPAEIVIALVEDVGRPGFEPGCRGRPPYRRPWPR